MISLDHIFSIFSDFLIGNCFISTQNIFKVTSIYTYKVFTETKMFRKEMVITHLTTHSPGNRHIYKYDGTFTLLINDNGSSTGTP